MRWIDYLRLSYAGIKAQKRRSFTVIAIVGLLFSIVLALCFIVQGIENTVLDTMLLPTNGSVLIMSTVDQNACDDVCDIPTEVATIQYNVQTYGGTIIPTQAIQTPDGPFYQLNTNVFPPSSANPDATPTSPTDPDAIPIAASLSAVASLAQLEAPSQDASIADKVQFIQAARDHTLHQVVTASSGQKYYIAEILPSTTYLTDLSLSRVDGNNGNILDLIFSQLSPGFSQNFLLTSATTPTSNIDTNAQATNINTDVRVNSISTDTQGTVFALFPNLDAAYAYYHDPANYCSVRDQMFNHCGGRQYRYLTTSAIANPLGIYECFQDIWPVITVVSAVLMVIAVIIALSTYSRLIGRDLKIISLYHAMGASRRQIRLVYITYFLMLSLAAVIFAMILGSVLALIMSLTNQASLQAVFMLALGTADRFTILIGLNPLILYATLALVLTAILAVFCSNHSFRTRRIASKLK